MMTPHNRTRGLFAPVALVVTVTLAALVACDRGKQPAPAQPAHNESAPTNRIDIPSAVRGNLGITFARVEERAVANTLRVPGRFELLPTARREVRTPLGGRVELLVGEYDAVQVGTPLYRVESAEWRALHDEIAADQARVDAMTPLRAAHAQHEQILKDEVEIWRGRVEQLEAIRAAGGGSASELTAARANLSAQRAELADVVERDAELNSQQHIAEAALRTKQARRALLREHAQLPVDAVASEVGSYEVRSDIAGVVERLSVTPGGLVEPLGLILSLVQPEQVRFRARGLQSDLARLRTGLAVRIVPPQGGSVELSDAMDAALELGIAADAQTRTVELLARPQRLSSWARAGVSGYLEIVLSGGTSELAIPLTAVVRDGVTPIIFRRDPANPDKVIRLDADLGVSDGRFIVVKSGVKAGDEIVLDGNYQLMLASSGSAPKGGHFHSDGTFHEGKD